MCAQIKGGKPKEMSVWKPNLLGNLQQKKIVCVRKINI